MEDNIFLSAGHHDNDTGAVSGSYVEAELTKELRRLMIKYIKESGKEDIFIFDKDSETNTKYQNRIRELYKDQKVPIIIDLHFNAGPPSANGSEVIISNNASDESKELAKKLQATMVRVLKTRDRGVKPESHTARGYIGILNLKGIACLPEVCFITNENDMAKYETYKEELARELVKDILEYV